MVESADQVLPANRGMVDAYLADDAFRRVQLLLQPIEPSPYASDPILERNIHCYVEDERTRLQNSLEAFGFVIDAPDTLSFVLDYAQDQIPDRKMSMEIEHVRTWRSF